MDEVHCLIFVFQFHSWLLLRFVWWCLASVEFDGRESTMNRRFNPLFSDNFNICRIFVKYNLLPLNFCYFKFPLVFDFHPSINSSISKLFHRSFLSSLSSMISPCSSSSVQSRGTLISRKMTKNLSQRCFFFRFSFVAEDVKF